MDLFNKAKEAAEKYHVKDKAVEYAQKQVAKREEEQCRADYVEQKDKSLVNKAVEAAEDFLAKQGQPKPPTCERRSRSSSNSSSSSSSSSSSDDDKCRQKTTTASYSKRVESDGYSESTATVVVTEKKYTSSVDDSSRDCTLSYPVSGGDRSFAVASETVSSSENYANGSNSGRVESYQEYWSEKDKNESAERYPSYAGVPQYGSDTRQSSVEKSTSYSSRVEGYGSDSYRQDTSTSYSSRESGNSYGGGTRRDDIDTSYESRVERDNEFTERTATVVVTEKKLTSSYSDDSSRDFNSSYPRVSREDETCSSFSRMALDNSAEIGYRSPAERVEPYVEPATYPRYNGDSQYGSDNFRQDTSASYSSRVEGGNSYGSDNIRQSTNTSTSYSSREASSNGYSESSSTVEKRTSSYAGESNSSYPGMISEGDRYEYAARRDAYPSSSTQYERTEEYASRSGGDYNNGERSYSSHKSSESRSGFDNYSSGNSYRRESSEEYSSRSSGGYNNGSSSYHRESSEEYSSQSGGAYNNAAKSYQRSEEYSSRSEGEFSNSTSSYQRSEERSSRSTAGSYNDGRNYSTYSSGATETRSGYEVESDCQPRGIQDSWRYPGGSSGVGMPYENYGSSNNGYNSYGAPSTSMMANRITTYPNDRV